jgi:uncharacterized protein YehS (DUF1456 family)
MKITKEQLRQIIKESISNRYALGKGSDMAAMMKAREAEEMELKKQAEMDGRTDGFAGTEDKYDFWENEGEVYLRYYMIGLTDAQDEQEYYDDDLEENKMKITKEQLKEIIKKELEESLKANTDIDTLRQKLGLPAVSPPEEEEVQAALAGEERPITWDTIDEINRRIDALELKVHKGID